MIRVPAVSHPATVLNAASTRLVKSTEAKRPAYVNKDSHSIPTTSPPAAWTSTNVTPVMDHLDFADKVHCARMYLAVITVIVRPVSPVIRSDTVKISTSAVVSTARSDSAVTARVVKTHSADFSVHVRLVSPVIQEKSARTLTSVPRFSVRTENVDTQPSARTHQVVSHVGVHPAVLVIRSHDVFKNTVARQTTAARVTRFAKIKNVTAHHQITGQIVNVSFSI